jgi:hypothetical protein
MDLEWVSAGGCWGEDEGMGGLGYMAGRTREQGRRKEGRQAGGRELSAKHLEGLGHSVLSRVRTSDNEQKRM